MSRIVGHAGNPALLGSINQPKHSGGQSQVPSRAGLPKQSPVYEDFSAFNNSPAILARGTRSVAPASVVMLVEVLNLKQSASIQFVLKNQFDFDLSQPPSTCSYNKYLDIAEYLRATFLPNMSVAAGYEEIGYRVTNLYFQGVAGQVVKMMARVMGPQKGAKQFLRSISNTLPWAEHELEELGPNHLCYHKRLVGGPPPIMLGILRAALEASGAKLRHASYTVLSEEEDDVLYDIEWS